MDSIKVLIAEDQEIMRKSLAIILNIVEDIEVVGMAENGARAIEQIGERHPELILMDINMPVMNGVEATKIIKEQWPEIKIIMFTTFQEMEYVVAALHAGAEGYILKDIDPDDLAATIRLVHRGGTMITQEVAKSLFTQTLQHGADLVPAKRESEYGLTEKELHVLMLISEGLSNRQIAERLFISEGTVKNYVSTIYSKLQVPNRAAAMKKAVDEKLL